MAETGVPAAPQRHHGAHRALRLGERAFLSDDGMVEYPDRWVGTEAGWRIAHRQVVVALAFGMRKVLGPAAR